MAHGIGGWLLLLGLCLTVPAVADVYQWVDSDGRVHFTDTPPKALSPYRLGELKRPSSRPGKKVITAPAGPSPAVESLRRQLHEALLRQRLATNTAGGAGMLRTRAVSARRSAKPGSSELCGLYRVSTEQYRARLEGCEGKACDIYQRQLRRFQDKTRRFCDE